MGTLSTTPLTPGPMTWLPPTLSDRNPAKRRFRQLPLCLAFSFAVTLTMTVEKTTYGKPGKPKSGFPPLYVGP